MLKNNTNQPERWKEVKFCEDIDPLKKYVVTENYRIVNWDNLEIVFRYRTSNGGITFCIRPVKEF